MMFQPFRFAFLPFLLLSCCLVQGRENAAVPSKKVFQKKIVPSAWLKLKNPPLQIHSSLGIPRGGGESWLKKHPFASAVCITTCNAIAADLLTQLVLESNKWEPKRTMLFAAFGFLFQGCAQYSVVNLGWEKLFPGTSPKAVVSKIAGMNLISDPLLFFPCFYIFQEVMEQGGIAQFGKVFKSALDKYATNCRQDWRNSWMVWFPGHAVTYGVMPPHKRIPWIAFLSFFYMCVLSLTRGGTVETLSTAAATAGNLSTKL